VDVVRANKTKKGKEIIVIMEGEGVDNECASTGDCLGKGELRGRALRTWKCLSHFK